MKTTIFAVVLALLLAGCSKELLTYEQAKERFSIGMTPDEVKRVFGNPTDISDEPPEVYWNYIPEAKIKKGPKGEYSAFTVVFKNGKAERLLKHDIVLH